MQRKENHDIITETLILFDWQCLLANPRKDVGNLRVIKRGKVQTGKYLQRRKWQGAEAEDKLKLQNDDIFCCKLPI